MLDERLYLWYDKKRRGMDSPLLHFSAIPRTKGYNMQFSQLPLSQPLLDAVAQMGFTEMTEIKEKDLQNLEKKYSQNDKGDNHFFHQECLLLSHTITPTAARQKGTMVNIFITFSAWSALSKDI